MCVPRNWFQLMMPNPGLINAPYKQNTWLRHCTHISKRQQPVNECCARTIVCARGAFTIAVNGFVEAGWWRPVSCPTLFVSYCDCKKNGKQPFLAVLSWSHNTRMEFLLCGEAHQHHHCSGYVFKKDPIFWTFSMIYNSLAKNLWGRRTLTVGSPHWWIRIL